MTSIFGKAKGSALQRKIEKLENELSAIKQIGVDRYLEHEFHQKSYAAGCDAMAARVMGAMGGRLDQRERELKRERDEWQAAYEELAIAVEKERKAHKEQEK